MVQDYEHFIIVDTTAILFPQRAVVIVVSPATMKGLYQENRKIKAMEYRNEGSVDMGKRKEI